jgi:hypothetical protein
MRRSLVAMVATLLAVVVLATTGAAVGMSIRDEPDWRGHMMSRVDADQQYPDRSSDFECRPLMHHRAGFAQGADLVEMMRWFVTRFGPGWNAWHGGCHPGAARMGPGAMW